jgi:hypothetical protein
MAKVPPSGKARREYAKKRVPLAAVVARPRLAVAHKGAPLTTDTKAKMAKLRVQARALFPGLR